MSKSARKADGMKVTWRLLVTIFRRLRPSKLNVLDLHLTHLCLHVYYLPPPNLAVISRSIERISSFELPRFIFFYSFVSLPLAWLLFFFFKQHFIVFKMLMSAPVNGRSSKLMTHFPLSFIETLCNNNVLVQSHSLPPSPLNYREWHKKCVGCWDAVGWILVLVKLKSFRNTLTCARRCLKISRLKCL